MKVSWGRSVRVVAALTMALGVLAGCSSSGSDGKASPAETTTSGSSNGTGSSSTSAKVDEFQGSDDEFYKVPDPLPKGEPGELIRMQPIDGAPAGRQSVRVMYHSRDATDADRAVTGVITYPTKDAPKGGWPVVSTAHGTSGIASPCAPSRFTKEAPGWGVDDAVWAMTDYIGLGPAGEIHPYLSRASEGHSVIDAVRAARNLDDAHASDRWLSIGHSQGGHGALSAHELAADYAPELDLLGTVALAPAAMFKERYGGIDDPVTRIVELMALYGAESEHPQIHPEDYVTPEAAGKVDVLKTKCLDEITTEFAGMAVRDGIYTKDPRDTEPAASLIEENDVGKVAVKDVPLFLISGTKDDRVVIDRAQALYDRLCKSGQETQVLIIEGADHGTIIPQTAKQTAEFLEARIAGKPATDSCDDPDAAEPVVP